MASSDRRMFPSSVWTPAAPAPRSGPGPRPAPASGAQVPAGPVAHGCFPEAGPRRQPHPIRVALRIPLRRREKRRLPGHAATPTARGLSVQIGVVQLPRAVQRLAGSALPQRLQQLGVQPPSRVTADAKLPQQLPSPRCRSAPAGSSAGPGAREAAAAGCGRAVLAGAAGEACAAPGPSGLGTALGHRVPRCRMPPRSCAGSDLSGMGSDSCAWNTPFYTNLKSSQFIKISQL